MDNIEQLVWIRSMEWGYYKHPPLPTWLLWAAAQVFGASPMLTYVLGAACTMSAAVLLWQLLVKVRGPAYAVVALLAALCITFYNGRLYYYNHNTLLLLATAASATLAYGAITRRNLCLWAALGAVLGLGGMVKYQTAITAMSVFAYWLSQRGWRDSRQRIGLLIAVLVAIVIDAPHLRWAVTNDSGPVGYAITASSGAHFNAFSRLREAANWLSDQVLNRALPAWFVLAVAWGPCRQNISRNAMAAVPPRSDPARALLLCWGFVPLVFIAILGILTGAELQAQWGTAFLLFLVPAVMELLRWSERSPAKFQVRHALYAFAALQLLLLLLHFVTSPFGPAQWRVSHWRNFDAPTLAARVAGPALLALGGPIQVVIGPQNLAGAIALQLSYAPLVLIDGRYDISPWVPADLVRRCGALQIGSRTQVEGGLPIGIDFPDMYWKIVHPEPGAKACPSIPKSRN